MERRPASVADAQRIGLAELVGWLDGTVASTPLMVPVGAAEDELTPP